MTTGECNIKWAKLSPKEFAQLQEYLSYSNKKVKMVLEEFKPGGKLDQYNPEEPINYEVFKKFMDLYLEANVPDELYRHLFLSFVKTPPPPQVVTNEITEERKSEPDNLSTSESFYKIDTARNSNESFVDQESDFHGIITTTTVTKHKRKYRRHMDYSNYSIHHSIVTLIENEIRSSNSDYPMSATTPHYSPSNKACIQSGKNTSSIAYSTTVLREHKQTRLVEYQKGSSNKRKVIGNAPSMIHKALLFSSQPILAPVLNIYHTSPTAFDSSGLNFHFSTGSSNFYASKNILPQHQSRDVPPWYVRHSLEDGIKNDYPTITNTESDIKLQTHYRHSYELKVTGKCLDKCELANWVGCRSDQRSSNLKINGASSGGITRNFTNFNKINCAIIPSDPNNKVTSLLPMGINKKGKSMDSTPIHSRSGSSKKSHFTITNTGEELMEKVSNRINKFKFSISHSRDQLYEDLTNTTDKEKSSLNFLTLPPSGISTTGHFGGGGGSLRGKSFWDDFKNSNLPGQGANVAATNSSHHIMKDLASNILERANRFIGDINRYKIALKDVICYFSLLEGGSPKEKLEFMFRLYDDDDNGILDSSEIDLIVNQMMNVAEYLGWDTTELRPILRDMMLEIDYDSDGAVTLEEWTKGGLTVIPLLVLLGLDQADATIKDDGVHIWTLKHFKRQTFCNLCLNVLVHFGRQGLTCTFCHYTVHERCVNKAPASCIQTYIKTAKIDQVMEHHWVEGNCPFRCDRCKKHIKNGTTGLHCCWCQRSFHNKCVTHVKPYCDLGEYRDHVIPPTSIRPEVLGRSSKVYKNTSRPDIPRNRKKSDEKNGESDTSSLANISFQINPLPGTHPLLVLINPKSGGRQGIKIMRKFQYLLNPRQVFNIANGGPLVGLQFIKDVFPCRILCCGGDGTVGWVLETMDKIDFKCRPPLGILPLGTGNDMARCLNWGGGYEGENLVRIMKNLEKSGIVMMDRWSISFFEIDISSSIKGDPIPSNIFNNYFSIGVDASIARKFHIMREKHPEKFNSRMRNKLFYFELGTTETFSASCKDLHENVKIIVDDEELDLSKGPPLEGVAILNIPSIYGGSNLWGQNSARLHKNLITNCFDHAYDRGGNPIKSHGSEICVLLQDIGDQKIEVVGLESAMHAGQVKAGLRSSGRRLAQGSNIIIQTLKRFPMQIDGEPWLQPPCKININLKNRVPMLMAPKTKRRKYICGLPMPRL